MPVIFQRPVSVGLICSSKFEPVLVVAALLRTGAASQQDGCSEEHQMKTTIITHRRKLAPVAM